VADFSNILDGKVVGGEQGEGVLIESIEFKFSNTKDGEEEAVVEIAGVAKTVLKDGYRPSAGFNELPEEVPVADRVKVVMATGKKDDNAILFDRLNKALDIQPPLVDAPETFERFTKDGKDSVYNQIVGKRLYFGAKKNGTKTGESASHYYFNVMAVDKRVEATLDKVQDRVKRMLAKKGAAPTFSAD
jgi:hypothetical protein